MKQVRRYIPLLLILVLTFTGHTMAIARGMPVSAGFMELCTGTGPVMVPVDAEGNPTGPAHICPEFSLNLIEAAAETPLPEVRRLVRNCDVVPSTAGGSGVLLVIEYPARGPPV